MMLSLYPRTHRTGENVLGEGPETVTVYLQQNTAAIDEDPHLHIWQTNEDHVMQLTLNEAIALVYTLRAVITSADPAAGYLLPKGQVTQ